MSKILLSITLLSYLFNSVTASCALSDSAKSDCGYSGIDESGCLAKGCCWVPAGYNSVTPWCFYSTTSSGYQLTNLIETTYGYSGSLQLAGSTTSVYGSDISSLTLQVIYESVSIFRVRITDSANERWEIPYTLIDRSSPDDIKKSIETLYDFKYSSSPFTFEVIRKSDGVSIFKNSDPIVYKNQFIELTTSFDSSSKTYGIGESTRTNHALESGNTYTLWNADIAAMSLGSNLYGAFPYYLQLLNGKASGAMLMNSNGIDVTLRDSSLTFTTIGGIVDLYVFVGPTPSDVISQYQSIVGLPAMMPYWSLGFHNCKYGYESLEQVEEVVANYAAANIPLDTQWMDIDYMQSYRDFTIDSTNFVASDVKSFVDSLHANGQHFVPIIDPGIMVYSGYSAYDKGVELDLFVKDITGNYYLGQVWPGPTYFPDFFHPKSQDYWTEQLQSLHDLVPYDGIWIDMNEVSNFCNSDGKGQTCVNTASAGCPAAGASQTDCCLSCYTVDSSNSLDFPPYSIQNDYGYLSTKTMSMSSYHYNNITVYNAHNLYGLTEQIATKNALSTIREQRPFLLTRSSFLSTGKHSAKWTGDNAATWNDLKSSIVSIMDFNMFGVPMIGADICGFIYDTTEELCARWIEVGAFYPFARDHNTLGAAPQELYLWDSVAQASRTALGMRYQLLPYYYTLFYEASTVGSTVARPLWYNFPTDSVTSSISTQFMIGSGVLVSPVLDYGSTSVSAYFPQGLWYDFNSRQLAIDTTSGGAYHTLYTPLTSTNVHINGGNILPLQNSALTTTLGRLTPFTYLTALDNYGSASGSLFWDDGEQINITNYLTIKLSSSVSLTGGKFTSEIVSNTYTEVSNSVGSVVIMGSSSLNLNTPSVVTLNGVTLSSDKYNYNTNTYVLSFINLDLDITTGISLSWVY